MADLAPPLVTRELRIVDLRGRPRIVLSACTGEPVVEMLRADGETSVTIMLDGASRPSVKLTTQDAAGLTAVLEVDEKGAHVKFDRPGGASSYLYLNNAGGSGVVLIDKNGVRRLSATVGADGVSRIDRFAPDGNLES